jgi:hypothetical protein
MPVARFAGARCSRTPAIARRSKVWRTVRFERGHPRCSGTQTRKRACQSGVREQGRRDGAEEGGRGSQ